MPDKETTNGPNRSRKWPRSKRAATTSTSRGSATSKRGSKAHRASLDFKALSDLLIKHPLQNVDRGRDNALALHLFLDFIPNKLGSCALCKIVACRGQMV